MAEIDLRKDGLVFGVLIVTISENFSSRKKRLLRIAGQTIIKMS